MEKYWNRGDFEYCIRFLNGLWFGLKNPNFRHKVGKINFAWKTEFSIEIWVQISDSIFDLASIWAQIQILYLKWAKWTWPEKLSSHRHFCVPDSEYRIRLFIRLQLGSKNTNFEPKMGEIYFPKKLYKVPGYGGFRVARSEYRIRLSMWLLAFLFIYLFGSNWTTFLPKSTWLMKIDVRLMCVTKFLPILFTAIWIGSKGKV